MSRYGCVPRSVQFLRRLTQTPLFAPLTNLYGNGIYIGRCFEHDTSLRIEEGVPNPLKRSLNSNFVIFNFLEQHLCLNDP